VFLTEVEEPVSKRRRSRSNLHKMLDRGCLVVFGYLDVITGVQTKSRITAENSHKLRGEVFRRQIVSRPLYVPL
jgi:hypothetical protein